MANERLLLYLRLRRRRRRTDFIKCYKGDIGVLVFSLRSANAKLLLFHGGEGKNLRNSYFGLSSTADDTYKYKVVFYVGFVS